MGDLTPKLSGRMDADHAALTGLTSALRRRV